MKILRFNKGQPGIVVDDRYVVDVTSLVGEDEGMWPPIGPTRLIANFARLKPVIEAALTQLPRVPIEDVKLLTPVPWPNKVIAYPVNYHDHGREMQAGYRAPHQGFFLKPNSSLSGAGEPVVLPNVPTREVHHESELAIVIGKQGRDIARDDWQQYVFGYACLLDMVVRGREERVFRKAYDTFCPVGPWIVTADELKDPHKLRIRTWVNGEQRQDSSTDQLIYNCFDQVAALTQAFTLEPGDIVSTGTPAGVGMGFKPPKYLKVGDVVKIELEGVGVIENRVAPEPT